MPEKKTKSSFCCAGDVQFEDLVPIPGLVSNVRLKPFSETCNYLQYRRPLTPEHRCFFVEIRSLSPSSIVTVGIADPDIHDDVHPGNWNRTVGYRNTGQCYSSHLKKCYEKFHRGDVFGLVVTHFGEDMSTVVFLKNDVPVATSYIFQPDHSRFLPTVALENGPIELGLIWPEAVVSRPQFSQSTLSSWIRPSHVRLNAQENEFYAKPSHLDIEVTVQSPAPLSSDVPHFEVIVKEASQSGAGPTLGLATCSPLSPPPTCPLLNDCYRWHPEGKLLKTKVGERLRWGVHYDPATRHHKDFNDKAQQLVLCYVMTNQEIAYAKMVMQPTGGLYPFVMLHSYASRLELCVDTNVMSPTDPETLDSMYRRLTSDVEMIVQQDTAARELDPVLFRCSEDLDIQLDRVYTKVALPREKKGIHIVQFQKPLTPDNSYFCVNLRKMGDSSVVYLGIADSGFPLNKYPGRLKATVGYQSRDGKLYHNDKDNGNTGGQRYGIGDCVGLEVEVFEVDMSVVLFSRNGSPVGTRFLTQTDHRQFLPTVAVCGNGSDVEIDILWQTRMTNPPLYSVTNLEHWCLPEGAKVDSKSNMVHIEAGHAETEVIQAPYSLHRTYNHFEVELIEAFDELNPPPAIALCTASPFDPTPKSNFKQDFIRFWATGPAAQAVKKGDLMGWGMLYPDSTLHHDAEQLVICYLTINRDVALTRVMYQPPGGFYPVVLIPPGVDNVKMNFGATLITEHPFTPEAISKLVRDAQKMISEEERNLAAGTEPEIWDSEENKAKYLKPLLPNSQRNSALENLKKQFRKGDLPGMKRARRTPRIANLVEMMIQSKAETASQETNESERVLKTTGNGKTSPEHPSTSSECSEQNSGVKPKTSKTCVVL